MYKCGVREGAKRRVRIEGGIAEVVVGRGDCVMKTTRLKSENATNGKIHIKSIILTRGAAHVDHKTVHDLPPSPYHWVAAVARRCQGEANTVG